jgi:putative transcriptional regulator
MAIVKMTLDQMLNMSHDIDRVKINSITELQLAKMIEEDEDLAPDMSEEMRIHPKMIRSHLSMTQEEFADLINIPIGTLRNWEQGRVRPDPAARSLMVVMAANLNQAVKALRDVKKAA